MGFDGTISTRSKNRTSFFNLPLADEEEEEKEADAEDFMAGLEGVFLPEWEDMAILKGEKALIEIRLPISSSTGLLRGEESIPADR